MVKAVVEMDIALGVAAHYGHFSDVQRSDIKA